MCARTVGSIRKPSFPRKDFPQSRYTKGYGFPIWKAVAPASEREGTRSQKGRPDPHTDAAEAHSRSQLPRSLKRSLALPGPGRRARTEKQTELLAASDWGATELR